VIKIREEYDFTKRKINPHARNVKVCQNVKCNEVDLIKTCYACPEQYDAYYNAEEFKEREPIEEIDKKKLKPREQDTLGSFVSKLSL
jgi:hypothetical protein